MARVRVELEDDLYDAYREIHRKNGSSRRYVDYHSTAERLVEDFVTGELDLDMMALDADDQLSDDDISRVKGQLRSIASELEEASSSGKPEDEELEEFLDKYSL
ncbi:hypothetical protein DMJ13_07120 [halophilic archaeon]|nr:hypothetical protein DMJ13_07120 [halophilic archaeon]